MEILYMPSFVRQYKKLEPDLQEEVNEVIKLFKENPKESVLKTHKLKGVLEGLWSFSVNYKYRIVFEYRTKESVVLLKVGDHDVYK